nr:piggyBac transposable element-derived protein 4-like [Aedes albopictus]
MKSKPGKYGVKFWCCSCVDCQYISNFQIYTGKKGGTPEKGQGKRVVLDLLQPFLNSWREVTTDNFFTSRELAEDLWKQKTLITGTLRQNKPDLPAEFVSVKGREQNSVLVGYNNHCAVTSFVEGKKSKPVVVLTTNHEATEKSSNKPAIVIHYNKTKGAVDTGDFVTRNTNCSRKTRVWSKKVMMEIINIACLNGSCVYRKVFAPENHLWRSEFLKRLCNELIQENVVIRSENRYIGSNMKKSLKDFSSQMAVYNKRDKCCSSSKSLRKCVKCKQKLCLKRGKVIKIIICVNCRRRHSQTFRVQTVNLKRKRCELCKRDRKTMTTCSYCAVFVYGNCSRTTQAFICHKCKA